MEIEAKYKIIGPLHPETLAALDLTPYTLRPGADLEHHDIMLDTPDRAITGSQHALRLRDENGARMLTLKGPGTVAGSIHSREEIEARLTGRNGGASGDIAGNGTYDYTRWPKKIASRVAELVGERKELAPLVELRVHRRTWIVEREGERIGELALDEGTIQAQGASEPVYELEVELKGAGSPGDLDALDARLRAALPLTPEPRSKLERGLALLEASSKGDGQLPNAPPDAPPAPPSDESATPESATPESATSRHATKPIFAGHTPLQLAARHAVKGYLSKLRKYERKVREGNDSEAVHDMRVATRRIRSALELLEAAPDFDAKQMRKLRRRLRSLAHTLGAVRDLDVFLARLCTYEGEHPAAVEGLGVLRHELERQRDDARAKLLRELDSSKLARHLRQVEEFATQTVDISGEPRPALVRHFAGGALWRRFEDVLRFECELPGAPLPDMHKLRITCKRARYAIELFGPALGDGIKPVTAALTAAQDHLGALQDTVVALHTVEELRGAHGDHHHHHESQSEAHSEAQSAAALAAYADMLALRRDDLRATFAPLWQRISDASFRGELAALLAVL